MFTLHAKCQSEQGPDYKDRSVFAADVLSKVIRVHDGIKGCIQAISFSMNVKVPHYYGCQYLTLNQFGSLKTESKDLVYDAKQKIEVYFHA